MTEPLESAAPRLAALSEAFALTAFDREVISLALLPEVDANAATPTVAMTKVDRVRLLHPAPLARWLLFPDDEAPSLLTRRLRLHRRIVEFLLGSDTLDAALRTPAPVARWISPREET